MVIQHLHSITGRCYTCSTDISLFGQARGADANSSGTGPKVRMHKNWLQTSSLVTARSEIRSCLLINNTSTYHFCIVLHSNVFIDSCYRVASKAATLFPSQWAFRNSWFACDVIAAMLVYNSYILLLCTPTWLPYPNVAI